MKKQPAPGSREMLAGGIVGLLTVIAAFFGAGKVHDARTENARQEIAAVRRANPNYSLLMDERTQLFQPDSVQAQELENRMRQIAASDPRIKAAEKNGWAAEQARGAYRRNLPRNRTLGIPIGTATGAALGYGASAIRRRRRR